MQIIACPLCNGKLHFNKGQQELICRSDGLAYPVRDGILVLLENEARTLMPEESP